MLNYTNIHHIALTISDFNHSLRWYSDILSLERLYPDAELRNPCFIANGPVILALFRAKDKNPAPKPEQDESLIFRHCAFCVDRPSFEITQNKLNEREIPFRFSNHSGQTPPRHSIYFYDPDGHEIEITTEV